MKKNRKTKKIEKRKDKKKIKLEKKIQPPLKAKNTHPQTNEEHKPLLDIRFCVKENQQINEIEINKYKLNLSENIFRLNEFFFLEIIIV